MRRSATVTDPIRDITCPDCIATVRRGGYQAHRRTLICQVSQTRKAIKDEWTALTYGTVFLSPWYETLRDEADRAYSTKNPINCQRFKTRYIRAGWGKPGRVQSSVYVRNSFVELLNCPIFSEEEKKQFMKMNHESQPYITALTVAQLLCKP